MTHADLPPTPAQVKAENVPLGELLNELTRDVSTLMRQEVELAKVELKESATKAGKGAGLMAGAAWASHFALVFLSIAVWWALGLLIGLGWSALIVAIIWAIVATILAVTGRKELRTIKGLPRTSQTLQEIPPTLKPHPEETR
ncbi:phage holin family protein [Arthrobacter sp. NyZ413]|uniref:phage holin family protein n=1 Tax=Arthrobacter sp. NyZ413 TaxID=3144669 RepID=UPI002CAB84F1|nr:phage holin family protein [Arthrobacter sp.]